jgi:hypothetical protein
MTLLSRSAGDRVQATMLLESLIFEPIVSSTAERRNNSPARRNHFPLLAPTSGNSGRLPVGQQRRRATPVSKTGDSQMRTFSFILAFAAVLGGPSLAGSIDNSLPGIGTFAYTGPAISSSALGVVLVAAR